MIFPTPSSPTPRVKTADRKHRLASVGVGPQERCTRKDVFVHKTNVLCSNSHVPVCLYIGSQYKGKSCQVDLPLTRCFKAKKSKHWSHRRVDPDPQPVKKQC